MKTQDQLYTEAQQHLFDRNRAFMEMIVDPVNPMTKDDLQRLIERWPERYERFAGFLGKIS